jgi:hypothetical protein
LIKNKLKKNTGDKTYKLLPLKKKLQKKKRVRKGKKDLKGLNPQNKKKGVYLNSFFHFFYFK